MDKNVVLIVLVNNCGTVETNYFSSDQLVGLFCAGVYRSFIEGANRCKTSDRK